ncbi:MAG TPA: mechanosensitive ion channel family protein, partial [Steroidobacteraceae bacterium]|nr:mechanosensitive ion channel family protein [Steroidobacteraceae bacterium]
ARMARTEETETLEIPLQVASRTTLVFLLLIAGFAGLTVFGLEGRYLAIAQKVITIALFWQAGVWGTTAVMTWAESKRRVGLKEDRASVSSIGIIAFVVRVAIWAFVLLLTLDNLGVDITALVAGLGIGGIAVALAVQNVLGDLLASLTIALDKPFVVGDFLIIGDFMGSVENVGIKSTRLRSLSGEQIVMSNNDLLSSRVRNYGRMFERRVVFTLGVTYETPREHLKQLPGIIREIVESLADTRFDRSHFARYGDFSLDFETVYYVLKPDFNTYMDIQQEINFRIHEAFERLGVEFAYPTRKLWLAGEVRATGNGPDGNDATRSEEPADRPQ